MAFCSKWPVRLKLILDNQPIEQVSRFYYLLLYQREVDVNYKLEKFNHVWHNKVNFKK
jgi:hypothetical protein